MEKNPDIQFHSPEEIKLYQEARLTETLAYLQAHSRFYQQMFKEHSIDTTRIKKIEDLQQIPVTTKTDLQLHNSEFICVDPDDIIDYVTTSGTLGDPVTFVLTSKDLDRLAYNEYLSFNTDDHHRPPLHGRACLLLGSQRARYGSSPCRQRYTGTAMGYHSPYSPYLRHGRSFIPY